MRDPKDAKDDVVMEEPRRVKFLKCSAVEAVGVQAGSEAQEQAQEQGSWDLSVVTDMRWTGLPDRSIDQIGVSWSSEYQNFVFLEKDYGTTRLGATGLRVSERKIFLRKGLQEDL